MCVTPLEMIDKAVAIAARPEVIFCSFGDMLRVPGSAKDLLTVKSEGGDVRIVYSPMDAVALARQAPRPAGGVLRRRLRDHRPGQRHGRRAGGPAGADELLRAGLARAGAAGHARPCSSRRRTACRVSWRPGTSARSWAWTSIGRSPGSTTCPIVVTGFEPLDILQGVLLCVEQLEAGGRRCENQYARSVRPEGNRPAMQQIREVFEPVPRKWRGIGEIPASGLALRAAYRVSTPSGGSASSGSSADEPAECIAGEVLQGHRRSRTTARPSAFAARRSGRWARRWSRPKGPARPITAIGGEVDGCQGSTRSLRTESANGSAALSTTRRPESFVMRSAVLAAP